MSTFVYGLMVGHFIGMWTAYFTRRWWADSQPEDTTA